MKRFGAKKIAAGLIGLALLASAIPATAWAAEQDGVPAEQAKAVAAMEEAQAEGAVAAQADSVDTGVGTLSWGDPGILGGYNLRVNVYVNGEYKYGSEQLRVPGSVIGAVNFTPAEGYYYHVGLGGTLTAGFDLDANMGGYGFWDQSTGYISFPGALEADREYDNVLSIYLWTFEEYANINIARRPWKDVQEKVNGIKISYDAYDPATGTTRTYAYDAMDFMDIGDRDEMESIIIPANTKVAFTGICKPGYEINQWSSAGAYRDWITLEGSRGEEGTEAYGATAYITVKSDHAVEWGESLYLYVDSVAEVTTTEPEESTEDTTAPEESTDTTAPEESTDDTTAPESTDDTTAAEESADNTTAPAADNGTNNVATGDVAIGAVAGAALLAAGAIAVLLKKRG